MAGARISQGDVLAELPFGNRVVLLELSGRDLRRAIENGLSRLPQPSGRFPQVSGMTVEFELAREPGSRITAIGVGARARRATRVAATVSRSSIILRAAGTTTRCSWMPAAPRPNTPRRWWSTKWS